MVGVAGTDGLGESVGDFEDDAFGAVVAGKLCLVLALHVWEGVHDVRHGGAGRGERLDQGGGLPTPTSRLATVRRRRLGLRAEVEVGKGGVQFAAEQEAALLVPKERRATPAAVLRECRQAVRRVLHNLGNSLERTRTKDTTSAPTWSRFAPRTIV